MEIQDYNPKLILKSHGSFNMSITLWNFTTTVEGSLFVVIQAKSKYDTRYEVGKVTNQKEIQFSMNSITDGGIYNFEIFYQNPNSFQFRSMFSISSKYNVTFVNPSSISLVSDRNMFYVNKSEFLTILINQISEMFLNEDKISKIVCKLGSEYLNTTRLSLNTFLCQFNVSSPKSVKISMVYKNTDCIGGEIDLSSNHIDLIFIGKSFLT
jgi:hypothetical protein